MSKEQLVISDSEAVELLSKTKIRRAQPARKFVRRTVVYPVVVYYRPEIPTTEIRTFVRQHEYCSESQWKKALEYEKQYPELQKTYRTALKAKGIPMEVKEPGNPLKATIIELK